MPVDLNVYGDFYVDEHFDYTKRLDKVITIEGKEFFRFMDFFFSPLPINQLLPDQVRKLCELRLDFFNKVVRQELNQKVVTLMANKVIELGGVSKILDFGCGNGYSTLLLKQTLDADIIIKGFDISDISVKNKISSDLDLFSADLQQSLPFQDNSFSVVTAIFVMHFQIDEFYLKEIHRVLGADGVFLYNIYNAAHEEGLILKLNQLGFTKYQKLSVQPYHNMYIFKK